MHRYAKNTTVSPEKSQFEIKDLLRRYGATEFGLVERSDIAIVGFCIGTIRVKIDVEIPDADSDDFKWTDHRPRRVRTPRQRQDAWEQAIRQRWRALLLVIKAKLEAVEIGISTMETEFMPFVVMNDGQTVGERLLPIISQHQMSGEPIRQLPLLA